MPNHITNHILIVADKGHIEAIRKHIRSVDEEGNVQELDFNTILPMPEELKGTQSPMKIITQEEYDAQEARIANGEMTEMEKHFGVSRCLTQEMSDECIRKYGYNNWYDWQCNAWGTKWNAYSIESSEPALISFDTAWSHPLGLMQALSKTFPCATFLSAFADEDIGSNCGVVVYKDGRHDFSSATQFGDSFSTAFALLIKGYDIPEYIADLEEWEDCDDVDTDEIWTESQSDHPMMQIARAFANGDVPELPESDLLLDAPSIQIEN